MSTDFAAMCVTKIKREIEKKFIVESTYCDDGVVLIDIHADEEHNATVRFSFADDGEIRVTVDDGQEKATRIRYRTYDMVTLYENLFTIIDLALVNW